MRQINSRQPQLLPAKVKSYWRQRGLVAAILPSVAQGCFVEVISGALSTNNATTDVVRPQGRAKSFSTTVTTGEFASTWGLGTTNCAIVTGIYSTANIGFDHGLFVKVGNTTSGVGIGIGQYDVTGTWEGNPSGTMAPVGGYGGIRWIPSVDTKLNMGSEPRFTNISIVVNATGLPALSMNGYLAATTAGGDMVSPAGAVTRLGGDSVNRYPLADEFVYAYIMNFCPTAAEVLALHHNPWQVFEPLPSRRYFALPAVASGRFKAYIFD